MEGTLVTLGIFIAEQEETLFRLPYEVIQSSGSSDLACERPGFGLKKLGLGFQYQ